MILTDFLTGDSPQSTSPKEGTMFSSLVSFQAEGPVGSPKVGDLATVLLWKDGSFSAKCGARITRIDCERDFFVRLVVGIPQPYRFGDNLVVGKSQVIDWSGD